MKLPVLAVAAVLVLSALDARADEITLKNGDKISGKVLDLAGGKLRIETAHSGVVVVDWGQVATLKTDAPVKIKLIGGDVVEGTVTGQDGKLTVGGQEVPVDRVKTFNEPPVAWHGGIDLAARQTDGNTHNTSMLLAADAMRASENDRITLKAVFRYGETSRVITERNSYGQAKYDYLFSETLYGYASGELMADKFKDLSLRWIVSAGVGAIFVKSPEMDLRGDVGLAYIDNDYRDGDDESHAGARISAHFRRVLPLSLELVDDLVFLPNFEEGDDWLARNDLAISTTLGGGWALKAGMITEYDNDPPDGLREHDNTYYIGLGYRF